MSGKTNSFDLVPVPNVNSSLTFPLTRVKEFRKTFNRRGGLRVGQAFHQFMALEKCVQHKRICDMLYQLDGVKTWAFISKHTDLQN